jgi:hypothetical protein
MCTLALETQLPTGFMHASAPIGAHPLLQSQIASAVPIFPRSPCGSPHRRHGQSQRRMKLPLLELPGAIHHALLAMQSFDPSPARSGNSRCTNFYDGLQRSCNPAGLASLLLANGAGAIEALSINHAGAALFASALALGSGLDASSRSQRM